jgi:hypothetical protein
LRRSLATGLVLSILLLAGCGGSSSDDTSSTSSTTGDTKLQTQFLKSISASLKGSGLPPDYGACILRHAHEVPIAKLKKVSGLAVFSPNSPAAVKLGVELGKQCIREGAGVSTFRRILAGTIAHELGASAQQQCVVTKVKTEVPDERVSAIFLNAVENGPRAAAKDEARLIKKLSAECGAHGHT